MSKKTGNSSTAPPETAAEVAASMALEALTAIRKEIRGIIDGSANSRRGDKTARIAQLAQRGALVAAEVRKAEQRDIAAVQKLSPAVVMTWVRAQTAEYRARLVRDVTALDDPDRRSVLG